MMYIRIEKDPRAEMTLSLERDLRVEMIRSLESDRRVETTNNFSGEKDLEAGMMRHLGLERGLAVQMTLNRAENLIVMT